MTAAEVQEGAYYWVWIEPYDRRGEQPAPLELVVARAGGRDLDHRGQPRQQGAGRYWDVPGTDEVVQVAQVVGRIDPPADARPPR